MSVCYNCKKKVSQKKPNHIKRRFWRNGKHYTALMHKRCPKGGGDENKS